MSMLLSSLQKWVEQGAAPRSFSFPLLHPTAKLAAIGVHPLNPLSPPPGGARGLNTQYHWVGQFRPGGELWCSTQRMDLVCGRHQPPISYTADTARPRAGSGRWQEPGEEALQQQRDLPVTARDYYAHAASLLT
jgi:hypothetical protein